MSAVVASAVPNCFLFWVHVKNQWLDKKQEVGKGFPIFWIIRSGPLIFMQMAYKLYISLSHLIPSSHWLHPFELHVYNVLLSQKRLKSQNALASSISILLLFEDIDTSKKAEKVASHIKLGSWIIQVEEDPASYLSRRSDYQPVISKSTTGSKAHFQNYPRSNGICINDLTQDSGREHHRTRKEQW